MVNATRRAKARLDSPGITLQQRVQADAFGVQQREVRAAIGGLPQSERRKARSEADASTRNGAHSAHSARGTDIHRASANHDRRDGAPVESGTRVGRGIPARGRHQRNAGIRSQVSPGVTIVSRFVNTEAGFRITRCVWLAGSCVERARRRVVSQRPDRVGREAARDECPAWSASGERLVRAPDTAAGSSNPKCAVGVCASRRNGQHSNAAGGCVVTPTESQNIGNLRRARAYEGPEARRRCL